MPPDTVRRMVEADARTGLPARSVMIRRGLRRRCPVCGAGHLFRAWVRMRASCPGCGLRFMREDGHWTGDLGLNTIATFGSLLVVLLGTSLLTYPSTDVGRLLIASLVTVIVVPVLFYPVSKTLWLAIDLCVNPLRPGELAGADRSAVR